MRSLSEIIKEVESIKQDLNSADMVMLLSSADSIAHMRIAAERTVKAIEHLKDVAECIDFIGQLLPIEKPVLEWCPVQARDNIATKVAVISKYVISIISKIYEKVKGIL